MFIYIYTYIYTYVGGSLLGRGLELLLVPLLEQRPRLRRRLLVLPENLSIQKGERVWAFLSEGLGIQKQNLLGQGVDMQKG
jgi:hypothetical protein